MAPGTYSVVWIDHDTARIVFVSHDAMGEIIVSPESSHHHARANASGPEGRRSTEDHVFFQRIANDLAHVRGFMVVGPANAKTEFIKHLHRYDPRLVERLSAIESMDLATDGQLREVARGYLQKTDRLTPHTQQF